MFWWFATGFMLGYRHCRGAERGPVVDVSGVPTAAEARAEVDRLNALYYESEVPE